MTMHQADHDLGMAELLARIADAEASARLHDRCPTDRDAHAEAAQRADEQAEASRRAARLLIEQAFPGVRWTMIADSLL